MDHKEMSEQYLYADKKAFNDMEKLFLDEEKETSFKEMIKKINKEKMTDFDYYHMAGFYEQYKEYLVTQSTNPTILLCNLKRKVQHYLFDFKERLL